MSGFTLGQKSLQSQIFNDKGERVPTTFIKTSPCYFISLMVPAEHKYFSIKLGMGKANKIQKPVRGEINKAGIKTPLRFLREIRLEKYGEKVKVIEENGKRGLDIEGVKIFIGDEIKPTMLFKKGDLVTVTGTSKGKGYQGVVKRHHFKGGPRTHGQSRGERAPGSIGMTTTPGRVFKGKRMAGRMGQDRVTVKNLMIIEVKEDGLLIKGLVPGYKTGLLEIRN
ncbi:MAG: 50S ribosomal protein L3 [Candidatus Roizmanbacteria bacterium GW2011_GWA2_35_19]|uniref:50S ribosomal protein L3 n=1 Tax=Candidatus Roizmanbacteria bacterium GW2011_GWA2_35_19 TaxID=1618478 RepID=A0A0G0ET22_9BACT|nr:MAG: 50S ribosomal protein L3 [Candidatus Roizmanbacteria bacterium GW2011_GWA2_35_19]